MKRFITCAILVNLFLATYSQKEGLSAINQGNLRSYMTFFASDEMQGREAGTVANDAAALYIRANLMRMGLSTPVSGSYYQQIPMQKVSSKNTLTIKNGDDVYRTDSIVLLGMPFKSMETSATVVFAGFGQIDDKSGLNEIRDVDMMNKIVIIMTGTPQSVREGSDSREVFGDNEEAKISRVLLKGAKAILMVYNPSSSFSDPYKSGLASMIGNSSVSVEGKAIQGIPLQAGFISKEAADMILKPSGRTLAELEKAILETGESASFEVQFKYGPIL